MLNNTILLDFTGALFGALFPLFFFAVPVIIVIVIVRMVKKVNQQQKTDIKDSFQSVFAAFNNQTKNYCGENLKAAKSGNKYGFVDNSGWLVIDYQYDSAYSFTEGLAAVCRNSKWGYINSLNEYVIVDEFENAKPFSEGLAAVCLKGKWGFIDKTVEFVIDVQFDDAGSFSEGLADVMKGNVWYKIDSNGVLFTPNSTADTTSPVIKPEFNENKISDDIPNVLDLLNDIKTNENIDSTVSAGDSPYNHDMVKQQPYGVLKPIMKDFKYGFTDSEGNIVIEPIYDEVSDFSEGYARVKMHWKYGFINKQGQNTVLCSYDDASNFMNGMARVKLNFKTGFINTLGELVVPLEFR